MSSTFVQVAGDVGRKLLIGMVLSLIGLIVGFGCALLPPAIPFAIVGIAGALLLWVIPELAGVPDRWARRMVPVMFLVFTCVPPYFALILPGLPWLSIHDIALLLWLVPVIIVVSGSAKARHWISAVLRASPWLTTCTLGYMTVVIITLPTAVSISNSFHFVVNSFLNYFIPMFGIILCVRDQSFIEKIFRIAVISVAVNFVLGAIEMYLQHPYLLYMLPAFMRDQIAASNPIAAAIMYTGWGIRQGLYRAAAAYTTSLTWGEICAMFIPFALHFLAHGKTTADKWLGATGAVLGFLSIVMSGARGAYVGMIAAVVCYSIVWSFRSTLQNKAGLAGKIGLAVYSLASVAALLAVLFVGRIRNRVLGGAAEQYSTLSRDVQWASAKPKILARPIFGYGGGSAGDVIHYISGLGGFSVDGYYMNLLVDYGIPGCTIFFSIFLIAFASNMKCYVFSTFGSATVGNALGSSILAFTVYRMTLSQTDSLLFAFTLIALTMVYIQRVAVDTSAKKNGSMASDCERIRSDMSNLAEREKEAERRAFRMRSQGSQSHWFSNQASDTPIR